MSQINFPNSPENGDEFLAGNGTTYQYDSATGQWKILAGPGVQGPPGTNATRITGEIIAFGGVTVPSGWLECNGQVAPTELAAVLGQANVPDLRGEFVRGWDNGKGTDSGRALLSTQTDEFKEHNHAYSVSGGGAAQIGTGVANLTYNVSADTGDAGGDETRPRNIALMYIIKT